MKMHLVPFALVLLLALALPAPAQQGSKPAGSPPAADFIGPESLMALIPSNLDVIKGTKINKVAATLASDAMASGTKGKTAQFRIKVDKVTANNGHGQKFLIETDTDHVVFRGSRCNYKVYAYFNAGGANDLVNLRKGTTITVVGALVRTDLAPPERSDMFVIDVIDCQLVPATR
jgi:hypothetical protein